MNIISIGELLWDVYETTEHLGGAPFNFAAHAHRLGHDVLLLSAVGVDERGERALARMAELGLSTRYVGRVKDKPTGVVTVNLDASGQPHFIIHRPAAYDFLTLNDHEIKEISSLRPDWIYFGTLHQMHPRAKEVTSKLIASNPGARRFYDINLRANSYEPSLVRDLMARAQIVKLNDSEALWVAQMFGPPYASLEAFCRSYAKRFAWDGVCVTRGAQGCVLLIGDAYVEVDGYTVAVVDTVGSGDAFAAAFIHGLGCGWSPAEIGDFANRLGALVASRSGAVPAWTIEQCQAMTRRV